MASRQMATMGAVDCPTDPKILTNKNPGDVVRRQSELKVRNKWI